MKPYSLDLREKIISTYEAGNTSIRKVAERFQVSKNTVQSLLKRKQATGTLNPAPATGGKASQLAGYEQEIAEMVETHQDYTLAEYCEYWQDKTGVRVSESTMCRFLQKQQLTVKKTFRSAQAAEVDKQTQRVAYWQTISTVLPENLVFLDEMGVLQGISRPRGRSRQGQRLYDLKPFYRGRRVTVVGAISQTSILAMQTLGQSMTGEDFKQFVSEHLVPKLWPGAVVVMDNLKAHKVEGIEQMIEAVGARVVY